MSTSTFALLLGIACLGIVLAAVWFGYRSRKPAASTGVERRHGEMDRRRMVVVTSTDRRAALADRRHLPLAAGF